MIRLEELNKMLIDALAKGKTLDEAFDEIYEKLYKDAANNYMESKLAPEIFVLVFFAGPKIDVFKCVNPSYTALSLATMIFKGVPLLTKDRIGIEPAREVTREVLDTELREIYKDIFKL